MLLENKVAVVSGAVARSFAREWATVFLAGRTLYKLTMVARAIGILPVSLGGLRLFEGMDDLSI